VTALGGDVQRSTVVRVSQVAPARKQQANQLFVPGENRPGEAAGA
jgi:hypothetical protein